MKKMFDATREIESDHVHKYSITCNGEPVPYSEVLKLWQQDKQFCSFFIALLSDSPFSAFRWETPPITDSTVTRHFEFVLLNSPSLERNPDTHTYAKYFSNDNSDEDVVAFENLGKDATLVVPSPRGADSIYTHLAAFIRHAPDAQKHALWRVVGQKIHDTLSDHPLWISTAGGGVAWLHFRLDSQPKYFGYKPYKKLPEER